MSEEGSARVSQRKMQAAVQSQVRGAQARPSSSRSFGDGEGGALVVKTEPEAPGGRGGCPGGTDEFHACHKVQGEGPAWGSSGGTGDELPGFWALTDGLRPWELCTGLGDSGLHWRWFCPCSSEVSPARLGTCGQLASRYAPHPPSPATGLCPPVFGGRFC